MKKLLIYAAIFVPFAALAAWTGWTAHVRETAVEVVLPIRGYDPRDLLSGHYIQYEVDIRGRQVCSNMETVVFTDAEGKTREWMRGDFACLSAQVPGFKENNWYGAKRFYIPEARARELDSLFRRRNNLDMVFEVLYAVQPKGPAIPKALLINGMEWQAFVRK